MEILRTIAFYTESHAMPFVVIGGHAINALGLSRHTGDLDLLVPLSTKGEWQALLARLRYTERQSDNFFSRFVPTEIAAWPIDLMYVDEATFKKLQGGAVLKDFGLVTVPVVAAKHLAILKLHAMKHFQEHRFAKDYGDLLFLLKHPEGRMTREELEANCLKYASPEVLSRLLADLKGIL